MIEYWKCQESINLMDKKITDTRLKNILAN